MPLQANNKEKVLELCKEATKDIALDPLHKNEVKIINSWSNNQMLGIIILMSPDKKGCGSLLVDMHNNFIAGDYNYPITFTEAFSLLLNYRKDRFK